VIDNVFKKIIEIVSLYREIVVDIRVKEISKGRMCGALRVDLVDGSFIDIWISLKSNRYSIHWDRHHIDGTIYRWNNAYHEIHRYIPTFLHHFHNGRDNMVKPYHYPGSIEMMVNEILEYVRKKIKAVL